MRYIFITLAFGFIFLFALALSGHVAENIELIPKPEYASPIVMDGRSMCMKNSEMNLIEAWEKKCAWRGEDENCALPKKDTKSLFEYKAWYVNNCR